MKIGQSLLVAQTWDGRALEAPAAQIDLEVGAHGLTVSFRSSLYGDPPPPLPAGRCPGLWDFEVVELFLLGSEEHYLELEWGPHGHWLVLRLHGARQLVDDRVHSQPSFWTLDESWGGRVDLDRSLLPPGLWAANAYAISGRGEERRFCAHAGAPGDAPDFHRLESFVPLGEALRLGLGAPASP